MTNKDKLQKLFDELVDIDNAFKRYDLDELKDLSEYVLNLIEIDKYLNTYNKDGSSFKSKFKLVTSPYVELLGNEQ